MTDAHPQRSADGPWGRHIRPIRSNALPSTRRVTSVVMTILPLGTSTVDGRTRAPGTGDPYQHITDYLFAHKSTVLPQKRQIGSDLLEGQVLTVLFNRITFAPHLPQRLRPRSSDNAQRR